VTRALILDGTLLGRSRHSRDVPLFRLHSGETVFGRLARLLALNGVVDVTVITGADIGQLKAAVSRPEFARLRFGYLSTSSFRESVEQLRDFLAGEDEVIVVADDLVFSTDVIEVLRSDAAPRLALCDDAPDRGPQSDLLSVAGLDASGRVGAAGSDGLRVLGRDGVLDTVATELTGGSSRGFWPVLKLPGADVANWLERTAGLGDAADAALSALNRLADDHAIALRPVSGRFVARVNEPESFAGITERARRFDLRDQRQLSGPRCYVKLSAELARLGITRALLVGDHSVEEREIAGYLRDLNVDLVRFADFSAVPTWQEVLAATRVFRAGGCDGVVSVGDEAAISVGKLVKLLAAAPLPGDSLPPEPGFSPIGHVTIPATGSAGSESTAEAVWRVEGELRSLRQDCMLPDSVLLDPVVWTEDPEYRRRAAVLGALSRSVATLWAPVGDAQEYALASLGLLLDDLFRFVRTQDAAVQQSMMTAVNLSGKAVADGGPSVVDALSYPLAAQLGIDRGEAAALCLAALWRSAGRTPADSPRAAGSGPAGGALTTQLGADTVEQARVRTERIIELLRSSPPAGRTVETVVPNAGLSDGRLRTVGDLGGAPITPADAHAAYERACELAGELPPERTDLEILSRFSAFCRARNLNCHLFGQTLRDAVTIGRLSPWSGPITVAMPRSSYDRLVRWRDQLPAELWLDDAFDRPGDQPSGQAGPGSGRSWSRIVSSPGGRSPAPDASPGITIRILESANDGSWPSQFLRWSALMLLHRATRAAEHGETASSPVVAAIASRLGGRLGAERLRRLRLSLTAKARRRPGVHVYVDPGVTSEFARSQYPAAWFGKGGAQRLGGEVYQAPVEPDAVLHRLFGASHGSARTIPTYPVPVPPLPADTLPSAPAPFISMIVPVYDVEKYLPECLDSLCLQDTAGYEVIAVDDGSPDGSLEILRAYERRFPRILRVVRKPNGGLSDARNFGMQFARGEYIGFVDSDDLVMPDMIRLMGRKAAATDADIVVCNHAEYWGEPPEPEPKRAEIRWMNFINSYGHPVSERPELLVAAHPYAWNKIYRRRLFEDYDIRYPKGQAFEDSATTFNLMLHANKIEYVEEALYFYRMDRAESITNTFNEKFYDIFTSFDSIREFYTRHGRYDEFREEISELMRRTSFARIAALETCRDPAAVESFLTAVYDYLDRHAPDWAQNKYFQRQLSNPKYHGNPKYRSMHSRTLMLEYLAQLRQERGDDTVVAQPGNRPRRSQSRR
jgi:glycosyltransferase involved in cell wall biosynthesis/alcohol dehydrogenase class IV